MFKNFLRSKHKNSPKNIRSDNFIKFLPVDIELSKIRPLHIETYVIKLRRSGLSPQSCNTYLHSMKSFFRWSHINYNLKNPTAQIKDLRTSVTPIQIPDDKEYKLILQTAYRQERIIIQFLANTGLRKREFFSLNENSFIKNFSYIQVTGKGNKNRLAPINNVCKNILKRHYARYNKFMSPPQLYREKKIYERFQDIAYRAKVKPFTPHTFRHYFATRLIRANVPLIIVSRILGHSNVLITEQIYCHLTPEDLLVTDCLEL